MKRFVPAVLCCLVATSLLAAPSSKQRQRVHSRIKAAAAAPITLEAHRLPDSETARYLKMIKEARPKMQSQRSRIKPNVVVEERSQRGFVIPAAGSVPGGGGTLFFRSDVTLNNNDDEPQEVAVVWMPIGGQPVVYEITPPLPAGVPPITVVDFVATALRTSGLGSLVFVPIDANGDFDEFSSLDGFSRIWTRQPGSQGTVSQPFPAVDVDQFLFEPDAFLIGLRQDGNFRTNFGIVNMDDEPHTFLLSIFPERNGGPAGFLEREVTVGANTMIQSPIPAGDFGAVTLVISSDIDVDDEEELFSWQVYGSSTDNITGDGWVSLGTLLLHPEDLEFFDF